MSWTRTYEAKSPMLLACPATCLGAGPSGEVVLEDGLFNMFSKLLRVNSASYDYERSTAGVVIDENTGESIADNSGRYVECRRVQGLTGATLFKVFSIYVPHGSEVESEFV